ncbi:hypothetical protein D3C85_805440 [compost metagenome]
MTFEITGDAADRIIRVVPDIDVAVTVEIHRVSAKAARHELRQAHGPGVRAFEGQWIDLFFTRQQQELTQFLAEKFGTGRIVETERGQGIDHPVITGITSEKGFNANDRHDDLCRHAVFLLGTGQRRLVLTPEVHTACNARIGDEHRTVFFPLLDPLGRPGNGVENRLLALSFAEHRHQLLTSKTVVAGHFTDELGHLRRPFVFAGQRFLHATQQAHQAYQWRASSRPATHNLH